jgi:mannan endo-1,4-beta-mannosidase
MPLGPSICAFLAAFGAVSTTRSEAAVKTIVKSPMLAPKPTPVNPHATREARALLDYLYSESGKVTLSGQHNQMFHMSEPSEHIQKLTGKYPLVWGGEWGFSDERHDTDNIKYRLRLLDQIRAQAKAHRIVVITYHQASPTIGEPCDFKGGVQVKITDADWDAILTEGTPLHKVWEEHVDRLAAALETLQKEHIAIIFRPYHEMNGDWFWWGGKPDRFKALWNMIYHRFVEVHHLNNVLWAWTSDRPWEGVEKFYPDGNTVDILGTDIYPLRGRPEVYPQEWYDRMHALAAGKPLALSEMAVLPTAENLKTQPWSWFMCWDNMVFSGNSEDQIKATYANATVKSDRR